MPFTPDQLSELELLSRFDLSSTQTGIKIHSSADGDVIAASDRLFKRGMITQSDGGYLTDIGQDTANHMQALITLLK
ncbi:MAG: TIGR02647 family protein [Candidatus Sedimenticola sp. (ex Thyasira tokunagai)]